MGAYQREEMGLQSEGWMKMTIRQVSEKYSISQDTLRYYEKVGMIPPVTRTAGGIRDYQERDLGWVELALCLRNAGIENAESEYLKQKKGE